MANRYWFGGSGTWNTTSTTNWSAASAVTFTGSCSGTTLTTTGSPALAVGMTVRSSTNASLGTITGGANPTWTVSTGGTYASQSMTAATTGASVPTASDNVIFDANSSATNSYTVTLSGALNCLDFTVSSRTPTFSSTGTPTIRGSFTLASGVVWSGTGLITFATTTVGKTITTNGTSLACPVTLNGVGGGWTLGSAFTSTSTGAFTLTAGSFSTGNFNMTLSGTLSSSNTNTRSISLGSSTITISASTPLLFTTTTGLTFNAGTSQINISGSSPTFNGAGRTYYNVAFTNTTQNSLASVTGTNTFNNLAVSGPSSAGCTIITFGANQTINGTFSPIGASPVRRIFVYSNITGTSRSLTLNGGAITANCDFRDINAVGGLDVSADGGGDCGGNTNITFPAPKTVYWNRSGTQNWSSTGWAATSGGSPELANFPLAQDTAVFNDAGSAASVTIDNVWNIGTVDMSARSLSMTLSTGSFTPRVHGSWANGAGVSLVTGGGGISFGGRGNTQQIVGNGVPFTQSLLIMNIGGTVRLQGAVTVTNTVTLNNGTLDLQSYTLTARAFDANNSAVRAIAFGTGNITVNGTGTVWSCGTTTNMATSGTQVINISNNTATATTVTMGSLSGANSISVNITTGTYTLTFSGNVRDVNYTGFSGTVSSANLAIYGNLTLSAAATYASGSSYSFLSTSGTKTITTNGVTMGWNLTFNGVGGTWQLQDNLNAITGAGTTVTLTNGTLDLNSKILSCDNFSSDNSNARTIAFGASGSISVSGATAPWSTASTTNMTVTGTPQVNVYGTTGSRTINPGTPSEANSISFNIANGSFSLTITSGSAVRDLTFVGTHNGTLNNNALTIYGDFAAGGNVTYNGGVNAWTFASTSGINTITTNGKTVDWPLNFNGVGGTWQLQDALTMGSTRSLSHTNGTLDLNGKTLTAGASYTTATGTKNLTFNGGTLVCPGTGSLAFDNGNPAGFTTTAGTGVGTISMTSASAKTFAGGGSTFNCVLNQGGAGALTITGSNTFDNITNTVRPASVLFTAGTTTTFTSGFSLSGIAGNLITISSTTAAQHTLVDTSGTIDVSYCSISYSNATGGATWNALTSNGNVNGGNNTGWVFSPSSFGNFFALFN